MIQLLIKLQLHLCIIDIGGAFHLVRTQPGGGGCQVSYTLPLRIACKKKKGGGVQMSCIIRYALIINGRPPIQNNMEMLHSQYMVGIVQVPDARQVDGEVPLLYLYPCRHL